MSTVFNQRTLIFVKIESNAKFTPNNFFYAK